MSRLDIGETNPATGPIRAQGDVRWSGLFLKSSLRVTLGVTSVWTMGRDGCTRPLS